MFDPFSLIIFWQFPSFSLRTAIIYSVVELWEGAEGSRREGALRLWVSAEPTTRVLGSWLKQIHYSGTVQPDEQRVKLGYREVKGSCHILSMKSGPSANQSTWNGLVNSLPTPKHRPPVRSYLTWPPPAASLALCLKTPSACQDKKHFLSMGSWGQSLPSPMFLVSGCLQWLCLKSSVDPGVAFHLSVCFCL